MRALRRSRWLTQPLYLSEEVESVAMRDPELNPGDDTEIQVDRLIVDLPGEMGAEEAIAEEVAGQVIDRLQLLIDEL